MVGVGSGGAGVSGDPAGTQIGVKAQISAQFKKLFKMVSRVKEELRMPGRQDARIREYEGMRILTDLPVGLHLER